MASDILYFHWHQTMRWVSEEALGQATICLTQEKEEVEEMEMSGEREGSRGRRESGGCYLGPCCVNS